MMRIRKIGMNGFGKFNDRSFDLHQPVTVFFGQNEAGKSTIMGFIRAMLFGFPTRANMSARYEPLRGGVHGGYIIVDDAQGREYRIERYDGAKHASNATWPKLRITLDDGTEAEESVLNTLLGQMNAHVFNNVFAFSLDELQHFSSLQSDEISSYLFSAGTGGGAKALIEAEKKLSQQLDQRFKPRGRIQPINVMLSELEASKQQLHNSSVSVAHYNECALAMQQLEAEREQLSVHLESERAQLAWLELCLQVHEDWTLLQTFKKELNEPLAQPERVSVNKFFWVTLALNLGLPSIFASLGQWSASLISFIMVAAVNGWLGFDLIRQRKLLIQDAHAVQDERKRIEEEVKQLELYLQTKVGVERREALDTLLNEVAYAELKAAYAEQHERVKQGDRQLNELAIQQGRTQAELERLLSDQQYRLQRQQHEELKASFQELVGEWATYALCMQLFKRVKHTYEYEKQPLVLQKAGAYLADMTSNRYVRIIAPLGAKTLRVEREDGALIEAHFLSRGTMEQLYLAMRFAFADKYANTVALPIVMDDILVNFDRERLQRTIALLEHVSKRHQIIVFTCHPHIRDELTKHISDLQCVAL